MNKSLLVSLAALVCALLPSSACAQVIGTNPNLPSPSGVSVVLVPTLIPVGGTATISAILTETDGSQGALITNFCSWTSSNPSIATVTDWTPPVNPSTAGTVSGIGGGTATITASCPNFSGSATITVSAPPIFTTPLKSACDAPPAVVQAGIQGNAYTFQPAQNGGTNPITWSISAGSLPNGLSISGSTGLISGTPSAQGTSTPTVQMAAANGTITCQLSITISANAGCGAIGNGGPPTYPCTPSNVLGAFALPAAMPFSGLGSAHTTCPGTDCGADNTIVLDPEPVANGNNSGLFHNPWARVTNSFSGCGNGPSEFACPATKLNVGFGVSNSDMDEEHWNTDDTMFYIFDQTGGGMYFYNFNPATMKSNLAFAANNAQSTVKMFGGGAFSRANNHDWYALNNSGDTGKGTFISVWDLRNSYPALPTHTADMSNAGLAFPSATSPCQPILVRNPVGFDGFQHFADCFSTDGLHNDTATYVADYHVDGAGHKIYRVWKTDTSQYISCTDASCTTTSVVCQNCGTGITDPGHFFVHNVKGPYDGQFLTVSPTGCTTTCYNGASQYFFQPATGFVYVACNHNLTPPVGVSGSCSGHSTDQYSHWVNGPNNTQLAWKTYTSNTSALFPVSGQPCPLGIQDMHPGNENNSGTNDDNPVYVSTSVDSGAENYANCMAGEAMLFWAPYTATVAGGTTKRMARLYMGPNSVTSCFSSQQGLGSISQTGRFMLVTSNMNGTLGCQNGAASGCAVSNSTPSCSYNTTQPRGDVFVVDLQ
jgi:hypothetical protein